MPVGISKIFFFLVMVEVVYFRVSSSVILKMGLIMQKYKNKKSQSHYSEGISRSGGMILEFWINKNNLMGYFCTFSVVEMAGMCVRMRKMLFPCLVFWD